MRRIRKSLGHAVEGIVSAMGAERNLQLFLSGYTLVILLGLLLQLLTWEWLALLLAGGFFLAVELLNTAMERMVDVLDDQKKTQGYNHYHAMMKVAKDIGAGASLVSLVVVMLVVVIVFNPYVWLYV